VSAPSGKRQRAERKGRIAELVAAGFLTLKGYAIVRSRFSSPVGEVDLIARRGHCLAFVEVKYRRSMDTAIDAVTPKTRRRIGAAAGYFISRNQKLSRLNIRYDIIALSGLRIRHLRDAWRDGGF